MKAIIFLILATQLYSCYCQGGSSSMLSPPMPTAPPLKDISTTAGMMVPPSPTPSPNQGGPAPSPGSPAMPTNPPTAQTAASTIAPSDDCLDKRDDCRSFGSTACSGIYVSWAKYNCPRHCGFCVNPNDTKVVCEDTLDYCDQYGDELCNDLQYRLYAEDNCKKYCNLCGTNSTANAGGSTNKPSLIGDAGTNGTECKDTVDYCWTEPDANCFGIYEPWAKGHCPYRCFFCPEKPPCEDKLDYCDQYDQSSCTDPSFINWARLNCRKTCKLCAPPVPPASMGGTTSGPAQGSTSGNGGSGSTAGNVSPSSNPGSSPTTKPGSNNNNGGNPNANANVTVPTGSVINGAKNTFIIQGPTPLVDGTCYYKGESHLQDKNWYDGCDYICNCLDAKRNRIICTERCTNWPVNPVKLDGCSWVQESGDCCRRLECNVN